MKLSANLKKMLLLLGVSAILIFFFCCKVWLYNLFYYSNDVFSVLQMSRSWLYGKSILWENRYGNTPEFHNYYTTLLMSAFTVWLGAKGFFLIHILIYFLAFYLGSFSSLFNESGFKIRIIWLIIFLLGPYSFWLFDDWLYGWHPELLFLPLSLFFSLALVAKRGLWITVTAVILVFTKEDGPVLACCIHLYYIFIQPVDSRARLRKMVSVTIIWIAVFVFSLLLLKIASGFQHIRSDEAFSRLFNYSATELFAYARQVFTGTLIMLLPLIVPALFWIKMKRIGEIIIFIIPLLIVGFVSGMLYFPNPSYSITWVTRFSEVMGAILAMFFIHLHQLENTAVGHFNKIKMFLTCFMIFIIQYAALLLTRQYDMIQRIDFAINGISNENKLDIRLMRCIAEKTPDNFVVAVPDYYFNLFEWKNCVWFEYIEHSPKANPDLVIFTDTSEFSRNHFNYQLYDIEKRRKFYILRNKKSNDIQYDCKWQAK